MTQLLPQAARLALRRALLAAQESAQHRPDAATTTPPALAMVASRLMSTATATRPATSTSTSELKEALKAKIPVEQVRATIGRGGRNDQSHTGPTALPTRLASRASSSPPLLPPPPHSHRSASRR